MRRKVEIRVGQQFRAAEKGFLGGFARSWVVEAITTGVDGQPHAVIASMDATHMRKTISVKVLADSRRYELVADAESPRQVA
jgi:hypothetical protein